MEPWLLIDSSYLARRAFHAMGADLTYDAVQTGVIFGFLRDVHNLQTLHGTSRVVFAFDSDRRQALRLKDLPSYKCSRTARQVAMTPTELANELEYHRQVELLRTEYLHDIGYRNILHAPGYEADDLVASWVQRMPSHHEAIMVTTDHDYYQLLAPNCRIYNPAAKRAYTLACFVEEFGLNPDKWAKVKAIAGCSSDDIPGVPGIGEATAAKFIRGELPKTGKTIKKITEALAECRGYYKLVKLPYPGCPWAAPKRDEVTDAKWAAVAERLGASSLVGDGPGVGRRKRKEGFGL